MSTNSQIQNKLFFITGGSEGIGKSVAQIAVANGAHVAIVARDQSKLEKTRLELEATRSNPNQKILAISLDVTDWTQVEGVVNGFIERHGCPDYLINCAGYARPGFIQDLSISDFHGMMNVNYFGIVNVCKAFVSTMVQRKSGTIVNTSSMAGFLGLFGYTGYCGSKYAVMGFSEALKNELKPFGIKVAVLCPPNTKTPGLVRENEFKPAEVLATEEKVKVVEPSEVAEELFSSLGRGKFMIVPTLDGTLAYYLKRLSPWVVEQFTRRPNI